jgi:hypothetical protein
MIKKSFEQCILLIFGLIGPKVAESNHEPEEPILRWGIDGSFLQKYFIVGCGVADLYCRDESLTCERWPQLVLDHG